MKLYCDFFSATVGLVLMNNFFKPQLKPMRSVHYRRLVPQRTCRIHYSTEPVAKAASESKPKKSSRYKNGVLSVPVWQVIQEKVKNRYWNREVISSSHYDESGHLHVKSEVPVKEMSLDPESLVELVENDKPKYKYNLMKDWQSVDHKPLSAIPTMLYSIIQHEAETREKLKADFITLAALLKRLMCSYHDSNLPSTSLFPVIDVTTFQGKIMLTMQPRKPIKPELSVRHDVVLSRFQKLLTAKEQEVQEVFKLPVSENGSHCIVYRSDLGRKPVLIAFALPAHLLKDGNYPPVSLVNPLMLTPTHYNRLLFSLCCLGDLSGSRSAVVGTISKEGDLTSIQEYDVKKTLKGLVADGYSIEKARTHLYRILSFIKLKVDINSDGKRAWNLYWNNKMKVYILREIRDEKKVQSVIESVYPVPVRALMNVSGDHPLETEEAEPSEEPGKTETQSTEKQDSLAA